MPEHIKTFSRKLTPEEGEKLFALLSKGNYKPVDVPYTKIAVKAPDCQVNMYSSGKILVQGAGTEDFVKYTLEPEIFGEAVLGYEAVLNPEASSPHMGIDESGKGDFFGPLVACAAYTDPNLSKAMTAIGVKDCKLLTDKHVLEIGAKLRTMLGPNRYKLVVIGPEAYNRLYKKKRNVNSVLSWAHARAIENLLQTMSSCPRAVADQFGAEHLIKSALMQKGKTIILEQRHKAESDIAVAAASILAREHFLLALKKLSDSYDTILPKGASNAVIDAGVSLVKTHGPTILPLVAKCHFRTADNVLSLAGKTRADIGPLGETESRSASAEKK